MSGSAAKAERRDLRRAVGEEAVSAIDAHTQAIEFLLPRVNSLLKAVEEHNGWMRLADKRLDNAMDRLRKLESLHQSGFWVRLRWLMTGR